MYTLEIEQDGYNRTRFVFDDLREAMCLIESIQACAATKTEVKLTCTIDPKGEEDDND